MDILKQEAKGTTIAAHRILILLSALIISAPAQLHGQTSGKAKSPVHKRPEPSIEETIKYINDKLAMYPTSWWEKTGCKGNQYTLSTDPSHHYLILNYRVWDNQLPGSCYQGTAEVFIPSLGDGYEVNYDHSRGQAHFLGGIDTTAGILTIFSCREDSACVSLAEDNIPDKVRRGLGINMGSMTTVLMRQNGSSNPIAQYSDVVCSCDDVTLTRLSEAIKHLVSLLKQQAAPTEPDPFAK